MKISVLIPAYRAQRFIEAALASVRRQKHTDWELIVVEDGSHDETEAIVHRFAATCRQNCVYDNLGTNQGVSAARNRLLKLATGEALAFLDADDTWEPEHLGAAVAQIENGGDFVVSGVRIFDLSEQRTKQNIPAPADLVENPLFTLFQRSAVVTSSAVVLTRELADRVGRFDVNLRIGEDRDFWLRCALALGHFRITRGFTVNYAKHDASAMARTVLVAQQEARFYEKHRTLKAIPTGLRRHLLAQSLINEGRLTRRDDRQHSAACFWRAWQCEPLNVKPLVQLAATGLGAGSRTN